MNNFTFSWKSIYSSCFVFLSVFFFFSIQSSGQVVTLAGWNMTGLSGYGNSPFAPDVANANLTIGGLTRGSGVGTSGTAAASGWGGVSWNVSNASAAISGNKFAVFSVAANSGYNVSFSSISAYNIRRSGTGPTTGQWQYKIGTGAWTDIGSAITWGGVTTASGNPQSAIDLSSISALQNISPLTTVEFRILNWGATAAGGTWYINGAHSGGGGINLEILGTVTTSASLPTLVTTAASSITQTTAMSGGNTLSDGGAAISAKGVVFGTTASPTGNATDNGTGVANYTSNLSGLVPNTLYYYRAYATNPVGIGYGNELTLTTLPNAPVAGNPNNPSMNGFTANWTAPSGQGTAPFTYTIQVSTASDFSAIAATFNSIPSTNTSLIISTLNPNTEYFYRIRSVNSTGFSSWSVSPNSITSLNNLGPEVTTNVATNISTTSATLNGVANPNGNLVNFIFNYGFTSTYGNNINGSPASSSANANVDVMANITGLSINTKYEYRLTAGTTLGNNIIFFTLANVPVAPTVNTPTPTTLNIAVNANGNPANTEFAIQNTPSGLYVQANGSLGINPVWRTQSAWGSTTVVGLNSSTTYTFQVKARNGDLMETAFSPTSNGTTTNCGIPTGITADLILDNGANFSWNNVTGDYEYVVNQTAAAPVAPGTAIGNNLVNITGLNASTTYYFHLRVKCGNNFSNWVSTPFQTLPPISGFVTYLFNECTCAGTSPATTADPNVTASAFSRGSGVNSNAGGGVYNSTGWTGANSLTQAQSANKFHQFSVSPQAGYQITYTALEFQHQRSGTGPPVTQVGYSTNGGASWTYSVTTSAPDGSLGNFNWTFDTPFTTTNNVLFRIWSWNATGGTGTYRNDNVKLSGFVTPLCNAPIVQANNVQFNNITESSAEISWTNNGTADNRYVFMAPTTSGTPTISNGNSYTGNATYGSGTQAGSWYCVYSGTANSVTVNNLSPLTTYRVFVVNGNCSASDSRYITSTNASNPLNFQTLTNINPLFTSSPIQNFNQLCVGLEDEKGFILNGENLTGAPVSLTAPSGYLLSLTSGENFASTINVPYTGDNLNAIIYVAFIPTAAQSYNGNIQASGGGAPNINIPLSGEGINTPPSISTGGVTFIGTSNATIAGSGSFGCSSVFSSYGIEYSATPAFIPGNGAIIPADFTGNNFSVVVTGLAINTVYYYRAYGIANSVTYYGAVGSFSTLTGLQETIYNYTDANTGIPFYVHPIVSGSILSRNGFGTITPCGSGYSGYSLSSAVTSFNPSTNPYVTMNIAPTTFGNQIRVERINVQLRRSNNGATQVMMAYSIDGGATWINQGTPQSPNFNDACGVVSNHSWTLANPITVGAPLAAETFLLRLYYYRPDGVTGGNNQILNLNILGTILQAPDTYYSVASGAFNDAIWSPTPVGTGNAVNFTPAINAVIQNGNEVILNQAEVNLKRLTINNGGSLKSLNSNPSQMRRLSINDNLIVNGVLGNGNIFDAIELNINGPNTIISGTGQIDIGQITKQSAVNQASNLVINHNNPVNLRFPGACLFNNANNAKLNVTINSGRRLAAIGSGADGNISIDGVNGNGAGESAGELIVNGTLSVSGKLFALTNNTNPIYKPEITIGSNGTINVNDIDIRINGLNDVGCNVTINNGGRMNVSHLARNFEGVFNANNGLVLLNNASLLHGAGTPGLDGNPGANVTGNISVRRNGHPVFSQKYNYWSSPVVNANVSTIISSASSAANTYTYNPAAASSSSSVGLLAGWISQSPNNIMESGRGYITTGAGNVNFTGVANNGLINRPLTIGSHTKINLLGNPYPSALNVGDFINANITQIEPAIYLWDDDNSSGSDYNTDDYAVANVVGIVTPSVNGANPGGFYSIATGQGFFVEAKDGATNVVFNNSMRNSNNNFFFNQPDFERMWVSVSNVEEGLYNETLIAFIADATEEKDAMYDAKKIPGNQNIALYTVIGNDMYSIQAFPELTNDRIIPLGLKASIAGNYTFSIKHIDLISPTVLIFLEDLELGIIHNLRASDYQFSLTESIDHANRFRIVFTAPIAIETSATSCADNDGEVRIEAHEYWSYRLANADGMTVYEGSGSSDIYGLQRGIYNLNLNYQGYAALEIIEIVGPQSVHATIINQDQLTVNVNEPVVFQGNIIGQSAVSQWYLSDGSAIVTNELSFVHHFSQTGNFTVSLQAQNGDCFSESSIQVNVVDQSTNISQASSANQIRLYPNPAQSEVFIQITDDMKGCSLKVVNLLGKTILQTTLNNTSKSFNVNSLPAGVYLVIFEKGQKRISKRLVVAN